jgi:hypothetical protein
MLVHHMHGHITCPKGSSLRDHTLQVPPKPNLTFIRCLCTLTGQSAS